MAKAYGPQIKKLQNAINERFDAKVMIHKKPWYSKDADRPMERLIVEKAVWDEHKQNFKNVELFSSPSDVQIILFLRDMWYELNGWEVPTDNEEWNIAKQKYKEKHHVANQHENGKTIQHRLDRQRPSDSSECKRSRYTQ